MIELGTAERLRAVGVVAAQVQAAAQELVRCFRKGGKLLVFGNGGSAAEAQHLAAELVGRFMLDRAALPAIALSTDTSTLTAISNDVGFERVFARQIEALGRPGDVALAISTSGRSANVLAGVRAARAAGMRTLCSVGAGGSELEQIADVAVIIDASGTAMIQEAQLVADHALCELVERTLFGEGADPLLGAALLTARSKVLAWPELLELRATWRERGARVVWTNGVFDLLHVGHVRSLEAARRLGDVLVVGLNGDRSVRALKGPGRPLMPADQRAEIVAAIAAVDHVVVFEEPTPEDALRRLQPEVHAKGADYADKPIPERAVVESYGGVVELLPFVPELSTTALAERLGPGNATRRAAFLDRDGTIIHDADYPSDPADVRLMPGAIDALRALRAKGFLLVLVSNQSGVGRGLVTEEQAGSVHDRFVAELARHDIALDAVRYCPHAPSEDCDCRKPRPGMILDAAQALGVDLTSSVLIGDKPSDAQAGRAAGVKTILLGAEGDGALTVNTWMEVVRAVA
jgi:rfaE bifunctional protein nucleotidyltransferase chain/domain